MNKTRGTESDRYGYWACLICRELSIAHKILFREIEFLLFGKLSRCLSPALLGPGTQLSPQTHGNIIPRTLAGIDPTRLSHASPSKGLINDLDWRAISMLFLAQRQSLTTFLSYSLFPNKLTHHLICLSSAYEKLVVKILFQSKPHQITPLSKLFRLGKA